MPNKPNKRDSRNNESGSRESRPPITDTRERSSGIAIDDSLDEVVLHLIEALKDDRVMRALHSDSDKLHDKIDSLTVLVTNLRPVARIWKGGVHFWCQLTEGSMFVTPIFQLGVWGCCKPPVGSGQSPGGKRILTTIY